MIDLQSRRWRSLANAFAIWLDAQPPALRGEIIARKRRGRVVLRFRRFPALRGRVWHHCLAVYASRDKDAYRLLDLDCLPVSWDAGVIICGFCEGEAKEFGSREALWADHLFNPFGAWVERKLMHAYAVEQKRLGRWRYARLLMPAGWDEGEDAMLEPGGVDHLRFYRRGLAMNDKGGSR